jgi:hypothetical protein
VRRHVSAGKDGENQAVVCGSWQKCERGKIMGSVPCWDCPRRGLVLRKRR